MDETSRTLGWLAGRCIAGQRSRKKIPIAYLYNGVRLPPLPERDREEYPYAVITSNGGTYLLTCYHERLTYAPNLAETGTSEVTAPGLYTSSEKIGKGVFYFFTVEKDSEWNTPTEFDIQGRGIGISGCVWFNFDLIDADGKVHFKASEPVPVYDS